LIKKEKKRKEKEKEKKKKKKEKKRGKAIQMEWMYLFSRLSFFLAFFGRNVLATSGRSQFSILASSEKNSCKLTKIKDSSRTTTYSQMTKIRSAERFVRSGRLESSAPKNETKWNEEESRLTFAV
jgi:heme/copper-type cytochrome/quinol oxidase subunit 3